MSVNANRPYADLFEHILDHNPDLIFVKAAKSHLVWANKAFRDLYGMTNEQLRNIIDSPANEPDYTLQYVLDDKWVWDNAKPMHIACEPVTRHDGVVRKVRTVKFPVFDQNNEVAYIVGISTDITETIEDQQKLEANSKMASLGEMAGGIAHEINNPLAVIGGKTRQLRRAIEQNRELPREKLLEELRTIEAFSTRIAHIVLGLRSFSRDGAKDPLEVVPLKRLIDDTLVLCAETLHIKHIKIDIHVAEETLIRCRPVQISQVLLNLINNSIDALNEVEEKKIWVFTEVCDEGLVILFRDSGPGIPDEIATKVMQPFFTTKEIGKGTGLGLSVSQSIVKDHGGNLRLDRSVSKSCFKMTFPKVESSHHIKKEAV